MHIYALIYSAPYKKNDLFPAKNHKISYDIFVGIVVFVQYLT